MHGIGPIVMELAANLWRLSLEAAPWLLLGLLAAGLLHALAPVSALQRWLGGRGVGPVLKAAIIGTPLPLCSCGVLPAAIGLHRRGASRGATVSFLIATPENGVDSIALTYALLGPFMTVARPLAALFSAVLAGLLVEWTGPRQPAAPRSALPVATAAACGDANCGCDQPGAAAKPRRWAAALHGVLDILDDIAPWLLVGLVLAATLETFVAPQALAAWGGGLPAMLLMLAVGLPMYICATASTPLAAALLHAGLSPGAALVFLLAGPATNLGAMVIVRRELGSRSLAAYLVGISVGAVAAGLVADALAARLGFDAAAVQAVAAGDVVPAWLATASVAVLVLAAIKPLRRLALSNSGLAAPGPATQTR